MADIFKFFGLCCVRFIWYFFYVVCSFVLLLRQPLWLLYFNCIRPVSCLWFTFHMLIINLICLFRSVLAIYFYLLLLYWNKWIDILLILFSELWSFFVPETLAKNMCVWTIKILWTFLFYRNQQANDKQSWKWSIQMGTSKQHDNKNVRLKSNSFIIIHR